jgi:hypothetical protein
MTQEEATGDHVLDIQGKGPVAINATGIQAVSFLKTLPGAFLIAHKAVEIAQAHGSPGVIRPPAIASDGLAQVLLGARLLEPMQTASYRLEPHG